VDVLWRGRLLPAAQGEEAWLFGQTKLKGANVSPLLFALGLAPAGNAIWPIDAAADMTLRGDRWTATRIAATVAGVKATGELGYQPVLNPDPLALPVSNPAPAGETVHGAEGPVPPPPAEVTGDLSLDRLRLGDLAALALGVPQPVKAGARWSDAKFAAPPLTLPRVAAHVRIGALDVNDGVVARGFAGALRLDKGKLDLDEIGMTMNEGAVSGHATLRRDNGSATLTGALSADSLAISQPGFSGRVGGTLDFASTGRSPAALIEGLAGSGVARFAGAELARSDPGALDRLVARAQAPEAQLDETNIAFFFGNELDKAPLPIPNGPTPIALNAGAIKFGPLAIPRLRGDAVLSATLDLRRLSLETRLSETIPAEGLKFWSALPPNASFVVLDALDAPKRHVDVSALSAGLATQAIARESERIAALEADIRERAFFNRRLKGERFIDRRNAEIEDWRIEQARLKGIAERLAAEREEAGKAASEKAAAEKAATEKAAAEKAPAEKAVSEPELPPDLPTDTQPIANSPLTAKDSATRVDELGATSDPPAVPVAPTRPRIHSATERATPVDPTSGGLY
jgi:hypothetical protein